MKFLKTIAVLVVILASGWLTSTLPSGERAWARGVANPDRQTVPLTPVGRFTKTPTDAPAATVTPGGPQPTETPTGVVPATSTAATPGQPTVIPSATLASQSTSTPPATAIASAPPALTSTPANTPSAAATRPVGPSGTATGSPPITNTPSATLAATGFGTTSPAAIVASATLQPLVVTSTTNAASPVRPQGTPAALVPVLPDEGPLTVGLRMVGGGLLIGLVLGVLMVGFGIVVRALQNKQE